MSVYGLCQSKRLYSVRYIKNKEGRMNHCIWAQDGEGEQSWDTGCRKRFNLNEGTPRENKMLFCCYCGKPIEQHVAEDEEEGA